MEKSIKRVHSAEFKLSVVLALMKQEKTMSQICSEFRIHSTQARRWKEKSFCLIGQRFSDLLSEKPKVLKKTKNNKSKKSAIVADFLWKRLPCFARNDEFVILFKMYFFLKLFQPFF